MWADKYPALQKAPQVPEPFNKKAFLPMGIIELREMSNLEMPNSVNQDIETVQTTASVRVHN